MMMMTMMTTVILVTVINMIGMIVLALRALSKQALTGALELEPCLVPCPDAPPQLFSSRIKYHSLIVEILAWALEAGT